MLLSRGVIIEMGYQFWQEFDVSLSCSGSQWARRVWSRDFKRGSVSI